MLCLHVGHNYCQDLLILAVQSFPVTPVRCIPTTLAPGLWLNRGEWCGAGIPERQRREEPDLAGRGHRRSHIENGYRCPETVPGSGCADPEDE